jgi:hypothetical protein
MPNERLTRGSFAKLPLSNIMLPLIKQEDRTVPVCWVESVNHAGPSAFYSLRWRLSRATGTAGLSPEVRVLRRPKKGRQGSGGQRFLRPAQRVVAGTDRRDQKRRPKFTRWHKILNRDYTQRRGRAEWLREHCAQAGNI